MAVPSTLVDTAPVLLLASDQNNRYPGELVTLYLRFTVPENAGSVLQLEMPHVMKAESYVLPEGVPTTLPSVVEHGNDIVVLIPLEQYFTPGVQYDIQIGVRILTFHANQYLLVESRLVADDAETLGSASIRLTVFGKGKYLKYLPELYEGDEFMGRFLMLFESFWKPISQQIDQAEYYFDVDLTPPEFVPWLASWVGLPVDESLPLDRMRKLLKNVIMLFQRRGTLQVLQVFLEIYTTGNVVIVERRATNFVLGEDASLGMEIALGRDNRPNSVTINLDIPETELEREQYTESIYKKKIESLVRGMIPAHVSFQINCAFISQQV